MSSSKVDRFTSNQDHIVEYTWPCTYLVIRFHDSPILYMYNGYMLDCCILSYNGQKYPVLYHFVVGRVFSSISFSLHTYRHNNFIKMMTKRIKLTIRETQW